MSIKHNFPVNSRVVKHMGVRMEGVVVVPFPWQSATDGTYRAPLSIDDPVFVKWQDGTQGWISARHLTRV